MAPNDQKCAARSKTWALERKLPIPDVLILHRFDHEKAYSCRFCLRGSGGWLCRLPALSQNQSLSLRLPIGHADDLARGGVCYLNADVVASIASMGRVCIELAQTLWLVVQYGQPTVRSI